MLSTESLDGTSGTEDPLSADPVSVAPVVSVSLIFSILLGFQVAPITLCCGYGR